MNSEAFSEPLQNQVEAWVARFAPLVMDDSATDAKTIEDRIALIGDLKTEGLELRDRVRTELSISPQLRTTFDEAASQLPALEQGLRRRLGEIAPGHEGGIVNLDALQERLAETDARAEMGLNPLAPQAVDEVVQYGNYGAAAFLGLFGLGWEAFTTFHASLLIGGFFHAFGPAALALLGFYAIFWAAGGSILYGAFQAGCRMQLQLEGRKVTITRKLGPITLRKSWDLPANAVAIVDESSRPRQTGSLPAKQVTLRDVNGKAVSFPPAPGSSPEEYCAVINRYLKATA